MTFGKSLTGKESELALTRCQSRHEQGFSSRGHSCDQSTSPGEVLREDGDSGQESQTVAHACAKMPLFIIVIYQTLPKMKEKLNKIIMTI